MDLAAELTLQIARFLQTRAEAPRAPLEWGFVPGPERYSYGQAREALTNAEKPIVLGVLHHPGYLARWRAQTLDVGERRKVAHALANQQAYLEEKLTGRGLTDESVITFEAWGDRLDLPLSELRRWMREYLVICGWTIGESSDATHAVRLLVLHGTGGWSPGAGAGCRLPRPPDHRDH
jgi:hypothetical protein